ncbi:MAG: hypothetical protein GQ552_02540, partial [Flavobacteriaceae bacterium]|nr:hypothetical protein [Flavobacteriaceae bacterium]
MSKLKEFVEKLEDFELASFYKYRFSSFMDNSKKIILKEFRKRKMYESNLDEYLPNKEDIDKQKLESSEICPRCFSNEFYSASENESITYQYATIDYNMNYKTCLVCLYSQD